MSGSAGSLAGFLLARIAEDEAVAREVVTYETSGSWESYALPEAGPHRWTMTGVGVVNDEMGHRIEAMFTADASHVARHDPARVLLECEAKRRIVDLYEDAVDDQGGVDADNDGAFSAAYGHVCQVLALPYADHPDYRAEWKP